MAPRLDGVESRDRFLNMALMAAAAASWAVVAILFTTRSPTGEPGVQAAGAVLLGSAVALTCLPLLWLAVFAGHRRIAYRGDWARAVRRAVLLGAVVTILVLLVVLGAASVPLALFVVALGLFVELILTARR